MRGRGEGRRRKGTASDREENKKERERERKKERQGGEKERKKRQCRRTDRQTASHSGNIRDTKSSKNRRGNCGLCSTHCVWGCVDDDLPRSSARTEPEAANFYQIGTLEYFWMRWGQGRVLGPWSPAL